MQTHTIKALASFLCLAGAVSALPSSEQKRAINPTVKSLNELGQVADSSVNRDSCAAVKIGARAFWTCRDTQPYDSSGKPTLPVWSSSSSWADFNSDGSPGMTQYGTNQGEPYFVYPSDECPGNSAGECDDGSDSRYALWPDSAPMVVSGDSTSVVAYTWIRNSHIGNDLSNKQPDPKTSLYKLTFDTSSISDTNALPTVTLVDEQFWSQGGIPYGAYGNVVKDGTAYLYGKPDNGNLFLAKVPAGSVEDKTQYQFWVNGAWQTVQPTLDDSTSVISNGSAGGQGTYYFSDYWNSYVWIGQASLSVSSSFQVTTAPDPTGPWETPVFFYQGHDGNGSLPAYSLQANPSLSDSSANEIYISFTQSNTDSYNTQLIFIEWN